jgi:hypothetical protein
VQLVAAVALTVVLGAGPDAPPAAQPSPEAEVEAALAASAAKLPPGEVVVVVEGPESKVYRLEEATVRLDGAPLTVFAAPASGPLPKGAEVSDGDHVVSARLVYRGQAFGPFPWESGPKWALPARVQLKVSRGLRLTIHLIVETNERAPVAAQRLTLRAEVEPQMVAVVDDAPLPPPPLPQLPVPSEAAPPVAAASTPAAAVVTADVAPTAPPKKKKKKVVARAPRPAPAVQASAPPTPVSPPAAAPAADTPEGLEQATARLRSALAAPRDGGPAPAGGGSR